MATTSGLIEGVLPYQEILRLCGLKGNTLEESTAKGPIQPCRRENVRSASYDLRLGLDHYFSQGKPDDAGDSQKMVVSKLVPGSENQIVLRPNQFVVVSTLEKVCLPKNVIGHLTLKQDILLQGLIMASQSQVDAGYTGWIYPLLYNLTDQEVTLQFKQSIIRLELVRLATATERPYEGDYQGQTLSASLSHRMGSSLAELRKDVKHHEGEVEKRLTRTRTGAIIGTVFALVLPIVLALASGFVGEVHDAQRGVSRLEGQLEGIPPSRRVKQLETTVSELKCELRRKEMPGSPPNC